ncbi:MAG: hypothetical protein IJ824_00220 [Alphaproteobacteria bacterium]|nr:hypothetical protein [Alphaproteobacteria bacterium]
MANKKRNTVVEEKIKNAEQTIRSYAYDGSLDQAIRYLKAHDPENSVLATIKDFENDRPTLKALNALYRADKAREAQDTVELERIAMFLGNYKQYGNAKELKAEADKILSEVQGNHEQVAAIRTLVDEAEKQNRMVEKHEKVQNSVPSMTDDDILANAMEIESIYNNSDIQSEIYEETVKKAKKTVTIDDEDSVVQNEDDLWVAKMMSALNEVTTIRMDDAKFAAKSAQEKKEELKDDAVSNFWSNLARMAGDSAVDEQADIEANGRNSLQAEKDCVNGKAVTIKAYQFFANIDAVKENMQRKVEQLKEKGKNKSSSWLSDKLAKFNAFTDKHLGITPVEFGKEMIGYFSHARGITNTVATVALVGAAAYSIPVGLAAAAAYGIYQSFAPSKWTIYEKKKANYDAAKAKGDKEEMKVWSGWNGIRNAYKAIQANPEEKKKFDSQRATNMKYGLASAAVVGLATPVIVGGGAMLGLSGAAAYYATRALSSGLRLTGANTNAYVQMKDAKNKFKEDVAAQSEDAAKSEKAYKRARTYFGLGIVGALFSEISMANSATDAYQADYAMGVDHNPDHVTPPAAEQHDFADVEKMVNDADLTTSADAQTTHIDVPQAYDKETMGDILNERQWNTVHATGEFDDKYVNTVNLQNADPNAFINADGSEIDPLRFVYMSDRIMSLAKAYPDGEGGYIAHMYDENHVEVFAGDNGEWIYKDGSVVTSKDIAPECWGTEEEVANFRALYHSVNCGESADRINNSIFNDLYSRIENGSNGAYMDVDDCGKVHFIKLHVPHKVTPPTPVPAPKPTPVDVKIEQTPTVTEVKQPDANIDFSYKQEVITGGTAPAEKGFKAPLDPLQKIDGDASKGQAFGNWVKIRGKGNGM